MVLYLLHISIDDLPETYLEDLFWHNVFFYQFADKLANPCYLLLVLVFVEVGSWRCYFFRYELYELPLEVGNQEVLQLIELLGDFFVLVAFIQRLLCQFFYQLNINFNEIMLLFNLLDDLFAKYLNCFGIWLHNLQNVPVKVIKELLCYDI